MARLSSPFVVPLVGFTIEYPYSIITEYMPNGSLFSVSNRWHRKFQLSGTHQSIIAMCIAHGLRAIRDEGILHRDPKSANIVLDDNRLPRICDFGIARFCGGLRPRRFSRQVGTYTHMAPELMAHGDCGPEGDVYSYGMVLYEMAEGRNPFNQYRDKDALLRKVQEEHIVPDFTAFDIPHALRALMLKCWDADPALRPTIGEIFEWFKTGRVHFAGTDLKVVADFAATIDDLVEECRVAQPEPVCNVSMLMGRLQQRMERAIQGHDRPYVKLPRFKTVTKLIGPEISSDILSNPDHPRFEVGLSHFMRNLPEHQFKTFYNIMVEHVRSTDGRLIEKVMKAFTFMIERNPNFIEQFERLHSYNLLPLSTETLIVRAFHFLANSFMQRPQLVDQRMGLAISAIIVNQPVGAAQLFVIFASKFSEVDDPWPVTDIFLSYARSFMESPARVSYLQALYFLVTTQPEFKQHRFDMVRRIFSGFIRSPIDQVRQAALQAICGALYDDFKIPFDALCRCLNHRTLFRVALWLTLRLKLYPPSRTFCMVLVDRATKVPRFFEALCLFADQGIEKARIVLECGN
jgi:serine/threonine protein kinase